MRQLEAPPFLQIFEPERFDDARGRLIAPITDADLSAGGVLHVHAVIFTAGATRGNHQHPRRTEHIGAIAGTFAARFRDLASGETFDVEIEPDTPRLFVVRAGVAHAFRNLGSEIGVLLCWADRPYEPEDIEPVQLI